MDVAYLSRSKSISESSIPVQSSSILIKLFHQSFIEIVIFLASASKLFSTNSLITEAGL
ncbi:MAG: hypothetical protein WCG25_02865 [bacterium]